MVVESGSTTLNVSATQSIDKLLFMPGEEKVFELALDRIDLGPDGEYSSLVPQEVEVMGQFSNPVIY